MSELLRSSLRTTWERNGGYLERLLRELLHDPDWLAQPIDSRTMNHPAWICCHLNLYRRIIASLLRNEAFDDPIDAPFGRGSVVSAERGAHPPIASIRTDAERLHAEVLTALDAAPPSRFEESNPLGRWREVHPRVGEQLVTLMVKHESFHLGQLSAWRRAMGYPSVPM